MRDKISVDRIQKLHPKARDIFTSFINECESTFNITLRITMGYRSIEEQNKLYAQGRTDPGKIVTNAKGGQSFHNFGLAIDLVEMNDGVPNWSYPMEKLLPIANKYGIEWGGNWVHIKDRPHFELRFGFPEDCHLLASSEKDEEGYVIIPPHSGAA